MPTRTERDSLGEMQVPKQALYGAQTRRAELNFPVSGWRLPDGFLHALAQVKRAAARVNCDLGKLDGELAGYIEQATTEIIEGEHHDQFIVDVFQTGSGTSTNMNLNEVIANRAIQLAGGRVGSKKPVHPNDHVNMGQSSNDIIPTALQVAAAVSISRDLLPALDMVVDVIARKGKAFDDVIKVGRTHLQDATPIRLGQVFSGYQAHVERSRKRLAQSLDGLLALPIGGTAVGTGLNTHPDFAQQVCHILADESGLGFHEAANHFAAQAFQEPALAAVAELKTTALALAKIANDIRFLASGPRCGYGEFSLPAIQPGSSIMPGKVNPVVSESLMQVAAYIVGADASMAHAAATLSNFELGTSLPLMAHQLLESVRLLANASRLFASACLEDLQVNAEQCQALTRYSLAMATGLVPALGYDAAADIAKEAYATSRTVRDVVLDKGLMNEAELDQLLDPARMTEPDRT